MIVLFHSIQRFLRYLVFGEAYKRHWNNASASVNDYMQNITDEYWQVYTFTSVSIYLRRNFSFQVCCPLLSDRYKEKRLFFFGFAVMIFAIIDVFCFHFTFLRLLFYVWEHTCCFSTADGRYHYCNNGVTIKRNEHHIFLFRFLSFLSNVIIHTHDCEKFTNLVNTGHISDSSFQFSKEEGQYATIPR